MIKSEFNSNIYLTLNTKETLLLVSDSFIDIAFELELTCTNEMGEVWSHAETYTDLKPQKSSA